MAILNGAIQAISSSAGTVLTIGSAFLGYWGFGAKGGEIPWESQHYLVLLVGAVGFIALGAVPFVATRTVADEKSPENDSAFNCARQIYFAGAFAVFTAIILAIRL